MSTISRRAFLKTVGVGALSVAAVSVLAGCDVVPGNTETPVVGEIKGTAGNVVLVDDKYSVVLGNASNNEITVGDSWYSKYKEGFKTKVVSTGATGDQVEYSNATADDIDAAVKAGIEAANKIDPVKLTTALTVTITNYTNEMIVLAQSKAADVPAKEIKSNTNVITVTCDGNSVPCAINEMVVEGASGKSATCTCYIPFSGNVEKVNVKVAIPGATKAVVYELTNKSYKSMSELKAYKGN